MTIDQFWYDEPRLLDVYVKKRELELDDINFKSWLIGYYNYYGLTVALSNAFPGKSGNAPEYPQKPLDDFNRTKVKFKSQEEKIDEYRRVNNYWAKLGKKGGK